MTDLNLEQLRKPAKERVRARRGVGEPITLSTAQFGHASTGSQAGPG